MRANYFRDLFESTRCGILTLDESGRVITANELARQILNLPETSPSKVHCQELLRDHPSICRLLLDALRMENPPSRIELELQAPGRPRRVIGGSVSHIRDSEGRREGVALFFKDLTHLERGDEQGRLKERLAAIGEMAAGLAHEIRNPLGNIGSTATLLKRKLSGNDSGILALNNIVQEVQRLNHTVTQCLEYAKPVNLKRGTVDLALLVGEAFQEVRAHLPRNRVQVKEDYDERIRELKADRIQLRQVFHNLIANAFDAMEGQGLLEISSSLETAEPSSAAGGSGALNGEAPKLAVVRIRDSGRGITPEVRERLFFPFFTTKPGGSGIGLAVAKKILDSHRGVIDVESEPGRGATFTVKLPYPEPPGI